MKKALLAASALSTTATMAIAGGVERNALSVGILFAEGDRVELSFGQVNPSVSGIQAIPVSTAPAGADSGDVAGDYNQISFAYKNQLSDRLHLMLLLDEPIGADTIYSPSTSYAYGGGLTPFGSTAVLDSKALTAILRYELENNISVYGGVRAQRTSGDVDLFYLYTLETSQETDFGYIVGAAWEKPEIAARVALTYQSEITHDFDALETQAPFPGRTPAGPETTDLELVIPQSLTLEFQSGVAADTLVFGSVRWRDWSEFVIKPEIFEIGSGGDALVEFDDDTITLNLGVGRRFNEEWSGAIVASHEEPTGGFSGNLGPSDGFSSLGFAVTRTMENVDVTAGARYIWIGDAKTELPRAFGAGEGVKLGDFEDNDGWAFGLRVAYNF